MKENNHLEIDVLLRAVFVTIVTKIKFIFGFTSLITVLSILYAQSIPPTYEVSAVMKPPLQYSVNQINISHDVFLNNTDVKLDLETDKSVFFKFLNKISSSDFQKKIFIEGEFLTKFSPNSELIDDVDLFITETLSSLSLTKIQNLEIIDDEYSISFQGSNADNLVRYLNELIHKANEETINDLYKSINQRILSSKNNLLIDRDLIIEKAQTERLLEIFRIKERDATEIKAINYRILDERAVAEKMRLNQITLLENALELAQKLGIKENQFQLYNSNATNSNFVVTIGDNKDLSMWYLYGEKALKARIDLLNNRTNNDPFIPVLVSLQSDLHKITNNSELETLNARINDLPFVPQISQIDSRISKLERHTVNFEESTALVIEQLAKAPESRIKPNKRKIVIFGFIISFILSILLALAWELLNHKEKLLAK